jgi:hypothetical protein
VDVRVSHNLRNFLYGFRLRQRVFYHVLASGGIGWWSEDSEAEYHVPEGTVLLNEYGLPLGRGGGEDIGVWSWGLDLEIWDFLVGFQRFELMPKVKKEAREEGERPPWDSMITFHLTYVLRRH